MFILYILLSFILGSLIGSFLNVVILRLPRQQSLGGRSYCPNCKNILKNRDLIPVVSFLNLLGKCRFCKSKISPRYFIIELITGAMFAFGFYFLSPEEIAGVLSLVKAWIFIAVLICVFVIDLEHFLILDKVILPPIVVFLVLNLFLDLEANTLWVWNGHFFGGILAAGLSSLSFFCLWYFSKGKWMGFGDVKYMLFLGVSLGWVGVWVAWFLAFLLGAVYGVFVLFLSKASLKTRVPFGTFLSLAAFIAFFWGEKLFTWYLGLLNY